MSLVGEWKGSVTYGLGADISLPQCLATGNYLSSQKWSPSQNRGEHLLVRRSGAASRGTALLVFGFHIRSFPRIEVLAISLEIWYPGTLSFPSDHSIGKKVLLRCSCHIIKPKRFLMSIRDKRGYESKDLCRVSDLLDLYFIHKIGHFDNFVLLYIAFAESLKIAIFHTLENRVILLLINVFFLTISYKQ